jgi:prepilin-type N-terminal cleavage/methylation domain-containing protein
MLAIGKNTAGFTLLEILAVILLVGLICTISYPNFVRSLEKTELHFVGELLQTDLQQIREEAMAHRTEQKVTLTGSAYYFEIGGLKIERSLGKYGFTFVTPAPAATEKTDEEVTEAEPIGKKTKKGVNSMELIFAADGSCEMVIVNWTSQRFRGTLVVNADGTSRWVF